MSFVAVSAAGGRAASLSKLIKSLCMSFRPRASAGVVLSDASYHFISDVLRIVISVALSVTVALWTKKACPPNLRSPLSPRSPRSPFSPQSPTRSLILAFSLDDPSSHAPQQSAAPPNSAVHGFLPFPPAPGLVGASSFPAVHCRVLMENPGFTSTSHFCLHSLCCSCSLSTHCVSRPWSVFLLLVLYPSSSFLPG